MLNSQKLRHVQHVLFSHLFPLLLSLNTSVMQMTHNFTLPCHLLITAKVLLHFSLSCLNSLHIWFCENGMALYPNKSVAILFGTPQRLKSPSWLKSVNDLLWLVQSSHCQTISRSSVPHLMPTLLWCLILRLYQVPALLHSFFQANSFIAG